MARAPERKRNTQTLLLSIDAVEMSIGGPSSRSSSAPTYNIDSSTQSRQSPPQQASCSSSNRQSSKPSSASAYVAPECRTWVQFKQRYEDKFSHGNAAQYTTSERVMETKQAQYLVARAIKALERDIKAHSSSDSRTKTQYDLDLSSMNDFIEDKQILDDAMQGREIESAHSKPVEHQFPDVLVLDDTTIQLIAALEEQDDHLYAERRQYGRRWHGTGLVEGVQILDDYTLAMIGEFNRDLASDTRHQRKVRR